MTEKVCGKCKKIKSATDFVLDKRKELRLRSQCRECDSLARSKRYKNNATKERARRKQYKLDHPQKRKTTPERRAKNSVYALANYRKNSFAINLARRTRRNNDPNFRLRNSLSVRIRMAVKKGKSKSGKTAELIGCSVEFLRGYLEARFTLGMTWKNYGEWHIDHRIPCAEFDLSKPDQQRQCFHYSNLQPLWAFDNLSKNSKRPATHQAELI